MCVSKKFNSNDEEYRGNELSEHARNDDDEVEDHEHDAPPPGETPGRRRVCEGLLQVFVCVLESESVCKLLCLSVGEESRVWLFALESANNCASLSAEPWPRASRRQARSGAPAA